MTSTARQGTSRVSVVIASVNGEEYVAECLRALQEHVGTAEVQVVVVDRTGERTRARLAERFPQVEVIAAPAGEPIGRLRARGVAAASGPTIAVLEDHCMVGPGWIDPVRQLSDTPYDAVGGPVINGATERVTDWAAFLSEYGHVAGDGGDGEVPDLPGNNVAYRASVLGAALAGLDPQAWEVLLHARLRRQGARFRRSRDMRVVHRRPFGALEYAVQRFHYSRSYAAIRARNWRALRRGLWLAAAPALPALLLARILRHAWRRRCHRLHAIRALPLIVTYTLVWTVGEAVGTVAGAGDSPGRVM